MPGQLLAVTRNAFVESIRQPFFIVWLAVVGFGIAVNPHLASYTFEDDNKLAIDLGLSMLLMGGLVLAAFTAAGVVSREIENRTALTVISKPIPRPVFIIGKYLGIIGALALAWWVWGWTHMLTMRQGALSTASVPWHIPVIVFGPLSLAVAVGVAVVRNYLFGAHFGATAARWLALTLPPAFLLSLCFNHDFTPTNPLALLDIWMPTAMIFVLQAVFLFAAVAVACSTRLGQVATLSICLAIFFLGIASDFTFGRLADQGSTVGQYAYAVIPNLQFLWLADAMTQGTVTQITAGYIAQVTLYTMLLVTGILALAIALFQTRQAS